MFVTIVGRGHSGTRAISHTLTESGVYMGAELNQSGDLVPADDLYEACRVMSRYVVYLGNMKWDFSKLHTMKIDPAFTRLVESYLASVLACDSDRKGWKLPETILILPWIVRMFPDIHYVFWVRDPRDNILGAHVTDDLADFNVPYERTDDPYLMRAVSWKYQHEIYKATPRPARLVEVRFEDFVLRQDETLRRLETFFGFNLAKVPVRTDSVGRWRRSEVSLDYPVLQEGLEIFGYLEKSLA